MSPLQYSTDKSVAQVATRWCLQKEVIPSVIIGPRTLEQLEDSIGAATGWRLSQGEVVDMYFIAKIIIGKHLYYMESIAQLPHMYI